MRIRFSMFFLVWGLALVTLTTHAETHHPEAPRAGGMPEDELQTTPVVIREIRWETEGRTRLWILERLVDLGEGTVYASDAALVDHLVEQQQILVNQRQLQEASVTYTHDTDTPPEDTDEPRPVTVHITTDDTWNLVLLPYARFDSNEGLLVSLRFRDYNFFGTLQTLGIDLDYEFTEEEETVVSVGMDFSLPFEMLQREWELELKHSVSLEEEEITYRAEVGLEYYFQLIGLDWTAGVSQEYRYFSDEEDDDGYYLANEVSLGTRIGLPLELPGFGDLRYSPGVYTNVNYRPGGISEGRRGVAVGFDHNVSAGGVNWIGNYRDGRRFRVGNDNEYNITTDSWDNELYGSISTYRAFRRKNDDEPPRAGVSSRISSFYLIQGDEDEAASAVRGILNDRMQGSLGVFLNLDANVTVWTLKPLFEMQWAVFFDVAYVRDLREDFHESSSFDRKRDLKTGTGIAVIGYPLFARSLFVRGSYGFDAGLVLEEGYSPLDNEAREIFIGLGHHY